MCGEDDSERVCIDDVEDMEMRRRGCGDDIESTSKGGEEHKPIQKTTALGSFLEKVIPE